MLICPNEGLAIICARILNPAAADPLDWQLILYANDPTLSQATVWADLVESTVSGYSRVSLTQSEWTTPTIDGNVAESTWTDTPVQWTLQGGPFSIYGYAIVTPTAEKIIIIESLATPIVNAEGPGQLTILPRYTQGTFVPCP